MYGVVCSKLNMFCNIHNLSSCLSTIYSSCRLREKCHKVARKQFKEQWRGGRVEYIPVEWRTWLQLDKGELLLSVAL